MLWDLRRGVRRAMRARGALGALKRPQDGAMSDGLGTDGIASSLAENQEILAGVLANCSDVIMREFRIGTPPGLSALLIYLDGLVERTVLNENILGALMQDARLLPPNPGLPPSPELPPSPGLPPGELFAFIQASTLSVAKVQVTDFMRAVVMAVFSGHTALLVDGVDRALLMDTKAWEQRGIEEPATEAVVRGPREGFTENIGVNLSLLRRKIHGPHLKSEPLVLGRRTNTAIAVAYVDGIVNPKLVAEVKRRLLRIDTDRILESGDLEAMIEDAPLSPFYTIANTERPDVAAAKILEGRVAILTDGTPFVLTVPTLFFEGFQVSEDNYSRWLFSSFIRLLRHLAFFVALFLPAMYVALQTFHQELLPTPLAIAMAADREAVPFPAALEALLMLVIFDVLRESGVRLPRPVGQAVSIVGTLVLGTAAMDSRLVSPAMVMVVAVTGIAGFVLPPQTATIGVLKFPILLMGSVVGLYGIMLAYVALLVHLSSLRSFGSPFFSPLAPVDWSSFKNVFFRAPGWMQDRRPEALFPQDRRRQAPGLKPGPHQPPGDPRREGGN